MPALQTTYSERMPIGAPGMPATMSGYDHDTGVVESATIGFGVVVSQGTAPSQVLLGATAAALFRGVSLRATTVNPANQSGSPAVDNYVQYENIPFMWRGDVWVPVDSIVIAGEGATFAATTGAIGNLGTSGSRFAIAGARWMTTQTTVGGLAILRLMGAVPTQNMAS